MNEELIFYIPHYALQSLNASPKGFLIRHVKVSCYFMTVE